jgi:hypothetical protein
MEFFHFWKSIFSGEFVFKNSGKEFTVKERISTTQGGKTCPIS